ncbi:Retrovirus-related Pol polyprotein from type-1 retrotransposable element R2 [Symbiodinium microadriaticum]|uniref:Retrovirus-related Pol polyprotein from type-1 retrotransposable element R2 n=1 Tax=Symbiodinium microadriaticum TaxID=2951 RepID=A0A1Q9D4L5_SYMMI|nr:Retrovirus-related Pol polyprotein from type-1 retrotransposable element R2 [Symbiodinium microadriaticum]
MFESRDDRGSLASKLKASLEDARRAPTSQSEGTQVSPSLPSPKGGHLRASKPLEGLEDPGEAERGSTPLTLALLQQALQVNQQQITDSIQESIAGIGHHVAQVEANMGEHVKRTTELLDAMTDRHVHIERSVSRVVSSHEDLARRLELLEGKFATASFSTTSTTRTDGGTEATPRPAIVVGGWDNDQSGDETLRLVKQHLADLECNLDLQDAFVPGIRRGFAIVPIQPRRQEDAIDYRRRVREALQRIREAKVVTGEKPQGGERYMWAAMSESPERRRRAQFAGKVKRLVLEESGDKSQLEVEFGTGNVWYGRVRVASAVLTAPDEADKAGVGWISLPTLARQMGTSPDSLTAKWNELKQDTHRGTLQVLTWNVGGLTPENALQLLGDLREERIHPFAEPFVALLQEVIVDEGKLNFEKGDLQMIAGKRSGDWRGTAIVHTTHCEHSRTKLLMAGLCCTLQCGKLRMVALTGHMPHHATIPEAAEILGTWEQQIVKEPKGILGMDANETFAWRWGTSLVSDSGRGELMLEVLDKLHLKFPLQDIDQASYFPYNQDMHPRRLDYVCTRKLVAEPGEVLSKRDLARSDREAVLVPVLTEIPKPAPTPPKTWGTRRLRNPTKVTELLASYKATHTDPIQLIADIAKQITVPGKQIDVFRESKSMKRMRHHILQMTPGDERKELWKQLARQRREEHRAWLKQKLTQAGKQHWRDKQAVDNEKCNNAWELRLRSDDRWRDTLVKHFGGIFDKSDSALVDLRFAVIFHRLTAQCKQARWRPFSEEELKAVRKRWKNSKACGPDSISHEALKVLEQDDFWRRQLLRVFDDMLYTAKIPACVETGITVLLAKTPSPGDWNDTRPITLSSTLLRSFSQLIIGRASHCMQGDSRLQWARRSRQGVELILVIRRLCRVSHDWGIPMYLAKLDIRKAFDSIYQEALAEQIEADVSIRWQLPWEARAWTALDHAKEIEVFFRGERFRLPQSNGVRQGSPDSPIAFGRIVALDLEKSINEAKQMKPTAGEPPPEDGGCFMDDSYLWSTSSRHLQAMLDRMGDNLPKKGLDIHPVKTEIIDNQSGGTPFQVAGKTVHSKGPDHIIRVLGSPMSFRGQPSMIVAEMQARARKSFAKHRGTLMSNAPLKSRLQLHTILVRQSALWACETWGCSDFVLKCANSTQLGQARNMLKQPRTPGEQWVDWNIRTLRKTRALLHQLEIERWSTFILSQIWGLHGHAYRGDQVARAMLQWRDLRWWRLEQSIPPSWGGQRHAKRFNPHLDVERQIAAAAGDQWQSLTADRMAWAALETKFVEMHDVPWASGGQEAIANLVPNRPTGSRPAYNEARERFAGLLNKHLLPRDNTPADNKPTQQATQPPPTTGDSPTEPTSATQQQNPDTTAREAAQPLQPPQGTAPATEQPMDEAEEEDTHCDGSPFTAEERAIQAEWAAGQEGTFWSGVVHTWEDGDDIPPSVPLSSNSHADMTQLTHGCWRIEVRPDKGVSIRRIAGIPRTVIEGDEGETLSSPPFPVGLEATFAPMTPHHWILTVTATPALSNYEAASMLLTVGDKILFERDTITLVWRMRIESQCKDCHPTITRMRQRREEAREREQQQAFLSVTCSVAPAAAARAAPPAAPPGLLPVGAPAPAVDASVWVLAEMVKGNRHKIGERVVPGAGLVQSGDWGLQDFTDSDGTSRPCLIRRIEVADILDFCDERVQLARLAEACEGDELSSADDVRTMEIRYGANGERLRSFREAVSEMQEVEFSDFPLAPRTTLAYLKAVASVAKVVTTSCLGGPVEEARW